MSMTKEQKQWIDNSTYDELLSKWRFAPIGDPMFIGEVGDYFSQKMNEKKQDPQIDPVKVSKRVGWGE